MILQGSFLLFLQDLQGFYQGLANILGKGQQDLSWILKILDEDLVELVGFSNKYDFTLFKVVHVISLSANIISTPYNHLLQFITLLQIYNRCDSVCINNYNVKTGFKNTDSLFSSPSVPYRRSQSL